MGYFKDKKSIIKIIDNLWSKIIKAKGKCEFKNCRKERYLNSHHIISRSNKTLRWDLKNGVCLCAGHHTLLTNSAHKNPIEFLEQMKEKRGQEWYDTLRLRAAVISKNLDYKLIKLELLQIIKELEA